MKRLLSILVLIFAGLHCAAAQPLERVAPEQVGMDSRRLQYADDAIGRAIAEGDIPGAVLAVVRHGKMAYLKAYGNKRVDPVTEPMSVNTIFDLASCSKPTGTAISVMILAERGYLRLQDPVSVYIPDFNDWRSEDGRQKRTIRVIDLMTHTSGLPAYADVKKLEKEYGATSPEVLMNYICTCKRDFCPQTDFQYSCLNYITLQNIVERVSGESLRDFARRNIFAPLGMNHTDYIPCRSDAKGFWISASEPCWASECDDWHDLVAPTEREKNGQILCGQVHDPLARVMNGGISGNAGVFSSAEDLAVLCAALLNGGEWNGVRILSPAAVEAMRRVPRAVEEFGRTPGWDSYSAYSSNKGDFFSLSAYGHTGFTGTSITIDPDNDTAVILLSNSVHPKAGHSVVRLRAEVANVVSASIYPIMRIYTDHYYKRFLTFEEAAPITPNDIVMLGDSLTEGGGDWGERLGMENVVNRGIVGDEALGIYDRLHQILPGHPARIFLLVGVNDISHNLSSEEIVGRIRMVVERIRLESPATKVCLQSLLPIDESFGRYKRLDGKSEMIPEINASLRTMAAELGVDYLDLYPLFTEKGADVLRKNLTSDGLHIGEQGYEIWVKALKKYIKTAKN